MLRELSRRELAFRGPTLPELVPCGLTLCEFYSVGRAALVTGWARTPPPLFESSVGC